MVKDETRMWFDIAVIIAIIAGIIYLKSQSSDPSIGPFEGLTSITKLFG